MFFIYVLPNYDVSLLEAVKKTAQSTHNHILARTEKRDEFAIETVKCI